MKDSTCRLVGTTSFRKCGFKRLRKNEPDAQAAFRSVALILAQQNVLDYLVAALLKQAQAVSRSKGLPVD
jgi:hypothetical protein